MKNDIHILDIVKIAEKIILVHRKLLIFISVE